MKKAIKITVWILLITGLVILSVFALKQHQSVTCSNLDILISYKSDNYFIIVDDINKFFNQKGIKIKGAALSDINAGLIEAALYQIPYVEKAEVYVSIEGNVNIRILQKKPIAKIFNINNQSYYIDDKGGLLPNSTDYAARVVVANGFINDYYNSYTKLNVIDSSGKDTVVMKTAIYKIFRLAEFLENEKFWKAMVDEIFINKKGEIEIYTKLGDQNIILGNIDNMSEKFENLLLFYKKGLSKLGWSKYKTINIKYKNQVVCSKIKN